jgi:hypothetical protein
MEPEYEVWWRVSEANESRTSYSFEQADIFQYQSYSHSDDIFIILKSTINTDTSGKPNNLKILGSNKTTEL